MKQHSLRGLLALVMLGGAALACGLPLPTALLTSGVVIPACAVDEPAATCALRQEAFEQLAAVDSVTVETFTAELLLNNLGELMQLTSTGRYTYTVSDDPAGFGADIHLWIDSMEFSQTGENTTYNDLQIILIGNEAYWSEDGGTVWFRDSLLDDEDTRRGLALFMGLMTPLSGEINLLASPEAVVAQVGKADGGVQRHMLTLDPEALVSDTVGMTDLITQAIAMDETLGIGLEITDLGEPAEIALMAPMLLAALGDVSYSARVGIDSASGEMVSYGETFMLNMSIEGQNLNMNWVLDATLGSYNAAAPVEAPEAYVDGDMGEIFGSPL